MATLTARIDLPVGEYTVRDAQAFTLAAAHSWHPGRSVETVLVLVDELASVVVEHADGEHSLVLELDTHPGQGLTVSIADGHAVRATVEDVLADARMLRTLLTAFTRRWDHEPFQDGYRLWFELLPATAPPVTPAPPGDPDPDVEVEHHLRRLRGHTRPDSPLPPDVRAALRARLSGIPTGHRERSRTVSPTA